MSGVVEQDVDAFLVDVNCVVNNKVGGNVVLFFVVVHAFLVRSVDFDDEQVFAGSRPLLEL